jgi:hypothetical protein
MAIVSEMREARSQQHEDQMRAMTDLTTAVSSVEHVVTDLRVAIVGNELGNPGLVKRQASLQAAVDEERGNRLEADRRLHIRMDGESRRIDRMLWVAAGVALGGGLSGGGIVFALLRVFGS